MRFARRHRRVGALVGALVVTGASLGAFTSGPSSASTASGKQSRMNCAESSTGITVGPYSVVCSGQAATGAVVTIRKATSAKFVAQVTLAPGTTLESESLSLNHTTGECTYVIGLTGGTEAPVTISAAGGSLDGNLDQSGGTLNPGDPSCSFK